MRASRSWPRRPHARTRICSATRNGFWSTWLTVCSLVTNKMTTSPCWSCTCRRGVRGEGAGAEAYKSLPGAAYGDEVGDRRVESVRSGIYPAKEGVTVVVSAANSAARKRPRTSEQGPRAVEDQAVQAAPRPGGPDSDEHGSELRANANSTAAGLAAGD